MNKIIGTSQIKTAAPTWERPVTTPDIGPGRAAEDISIWWSLVDRVIEIAMPNGWTKTEVARRINMPDGTFSQWFSGKYNGRLDNQNKLVTQWLDAIEEQSGLAATIPVSPPFIRTKTAAEIHETLQWAQLTADFVFITLPAGSGKTEACKYYRATRPHAYLATVSPHTKTVHAMLVELAAELDVQENNPAKLTRAIGNKIRKIGSGSLLIVDEAQNLVDDAVNQLRHFVDIYGCGVALVGNNEVYSRFTKKTDGPSFDQIKRRIGKRLNRTKIRTEDLDALIAAWGVHDAASAKLLVGIGSKGGALGQIDKTMKLATMLAIGAGEQLCVEHINAAWKNRDVEDIA